MMATMADKENFSNFRVVKMVKFGFFLIYFTHLTLSLVELIFHLNNTYNLQVVQAIKSYII